MEDKDALYLDRCVQLAMLAGSKVKSNPNVGAVLVYDDRIIGEGWHAAYGQPHAEVNAILSVKPEDQDLISLSTLYVSLEPCCHFGKTPPCTLKIIHQNISKVVIGCLDPNPLVAGKGIQTLQDHGIEVVLKDHAACKSILERFIVNLLKRPYVILKWAQSKDGFIGNSQEQVSISNHYTQVQSHKWRREVDAIMVGAKTVLVDKPQLTARHFDGKSPVRVFMDSNLVAQEYYNTMHRESKAIVFNLLRNDKNDQIEYIQVKDLKDLETILKLLFDKEIFTLLVEGGATLLNSFIDSTIWDEARIIKTKKMLFKDVKAPFLEGRLIHKKIYDDNLIQYVKP